MRTITILRAYNFELSHVPLIYTEAPSTKCAFLGTHPWGMKLTPQKVSVDQSV